MQADDYGSGDCDDDDHDDDDVDDDDDYDDYTGHVIWNLTLHRCPRPGQDEPTGFNYKMQIRTQASSSHLFYSDFFPPILSSQLYYENYFPRYEVEKGLRAIY